VGGDRLPWVVCYWRPEWLVTVTAGRLTHDIPRSGSLRAIEAIAQEAVTGLVGRASDVADDLDLADGSTDLAALRRRISALRRTSVAQQDVLARIAHQDDPDPAIGAGFRSAVARLAQVVGELDLLREEAHQIAADRQEDVVRRLTVVAAVFLPLTFLTGFFGQNFPWMVERIGGPWWFAGLGLVLPVVVVAALLGFFRLKRWL
jgi:magnesium transporter